MKQENIKKRQNEDFMLKCQYVSRYFYNKAEILNYVVWGICILSAFTIFLPDTNSWYILGLPLLLDIIGCIFESRLEKCVSTAAKLRNYFDAYVLDLNVSTYSDTDIREIKNIIIKIVAKNQNKCNTQISNTGNDTPPGVRDWYEFSHPFSDEAVQFECMEQNCWWDKELSKVDILLHILFGVIILLLMLVFLHLKIWKNILRILLCSGILLKIGERVYTNIKYYILSLQIDAVEKVVSSSKTEPNLLHLQSLIEQRRTLPKLKSNFLHRYLANKLSEEYRNIS